MADVVLEFASNNQVNQAEEDPKDRNTKRIKGAENNFFSGSTLPLVYDELGYDHHVQNNS